MSATAPASERPTSSSAFRGRSVRGWLPRSLAPSFRGVAAKPTYTEGSTSADAEADVDERTMMKLAAFDGAARDEDDWAYALRWTDLSGNGAATVLAQMQAAGNSDGVGLGSSTDGQQIQPHGHSHQRRAPSLGDAGALAAAARRAVSYRGKVMPEATSSATSATEPPVGGEAAAAATGASAAAAAALAAAPATPHVRRGLHRRSAST